MQPMTRRGFLANSGKAVTGAAVGAAVSTLMTGNVLGANERPRVALIGCGGRGRIVMRGLIEHGAELVCLCDLRDDRLDGTAKFLASVQAKPARNVKDMQQVFDAKDVDAVLVATPDHWHAPAAIRAVQAGKDIYVEKPHAHNIFESRQMVAAAGKYDRIIQVGTQNRSAPYNHAAVEYITSGKLGSIHLVKVFNLKPGGPFRLGDAGKPPAGFDWDAWLGPAPARPYHQRIFGSGWHHFWDYSGGDFADDGIHQMDLALMLMGNPGAPSAVASSGGRLAHKGDDSQVPDVLVSTFEYPDFVLTFEHSNYPKYMAKTTSTIRRNDLMPYWTQNATRVEIYGSELMMTVGRHGGGWIVQKSGGREVHKEFGRFPDPPHQQNFIDCIRSRKKPNADVATLHPSICLLHMANIAHRVGNVKLQFDAKAERFDNPAANKLIKRDYRKGYEVPDVV